MIIILLNIAASTRYTELEEIISPSLKGGLFSSDGKLKSISLFEVKDKDTKENEYHGFVQIEPEAAALRAIKKLDGMMLKGQKITARQYHYRDLQSDRRDDSRKKSAKFTEKRTKHNRRRNLETIRTPIFFHTADAH